jgi:large subunit ribosomal protein L41
MKPTPALASRVRFTTKQVGGGFYRGSRTGATGAHTQWGGYLIDYRKVRHFNCPDDLEKFDVRALSVTLSNSDTNAIHSSNHT